MIKKKIKLVQVTHDLSLGGLQRVIVNICRTIDREKFDLTVLCLRELGCFTDEVKALGIPVTLIPQTKRTDYLSFLKVAHFFRQIKPDVIHTHNTQPFIDGTIAALLTGVKRIIHTDHARSFPDKWRYMAIEWFMSHFAYKIVGVSEHTTQNLIRYEKISQKKIMTIPNGIDPTPFKIPFDKKKKRKELKLPEVGPVLGVAVRLSEQKGLKYLIRAMPEIIQQFPTVSLVIAGDGPLMHSLVEDTKQLHVEKNVYFLGTRQDTPELLKLFDLYVLPSLWEGLPMIILEAMAAGCPIVATDVGGVATAVRDGVNGVLLKPPAINLLGTIIINLLNDSTRCSSFSINSLTIFNNEFSAINMTQRYQQLYSC